MDSGYSASSVACPSFTNSHHPASSGKPGAFSIAPPPASWNTALAASGTVRMRTASLLAAGSSRPGHRQARSNSTAPSATLVSQPNHMPSGRASVPGEHPEPSAAVGPSDTVGERPYTAVAHAGSGPVVEVASTTVVVVSAGAVVVVEGGAMVVASDGAVVAGGSVVIAASVADTAVSAVVPVPLPHAATAISNSALSQEVMRMGSSFLASSIITLRRSRGQGPSMPAGALVRTPKRDLRPGAPATANPSHPPRMFGRGGGAV